jgi:hypothetical protein
VERTAALAAMRPLERIEHVLGHLRHDRERLLGGGRPGALECYAAATADGACCVLPVAPQEAPRARRLPAAVAAALACSAELPAPLDGADLALEAASWHGWLAIRCSTPHGADVVELLPLALEEESRDLDRVRVRAVALPAGMLDDTQPAAADWLWRAELAARSGGHPAAPALPAEIERAMTAFAATRPPADDDGSELWGAAHDDPLPARRIVRRILRRLDGMGKYGGYHTEFSHLARGFAGHERALALRAGEELLRAGLLAEKPSVGQRHVSLVAARTTEIRRLIAVGETDDPALGGFLEGR